MNEKNAENAEPDDETEAPAEAELPPPIQGGYFDKQSKEQREASHSATRGWWEDLKRIARGHRGSKGLGA